MSLRDKQIFFTNVATFNEIAKPASHHPGLTFGNWKVFSEPKRIVGGGACSSPTTDWAERYHSNVFKSGEKKFTKVVFTSSCNKQHASSPTTSTRGSPNSGSGQSPKSTSSPTAASVTRPSTVTSQMSLEGHQILQQLDREPSRPQQPEPKPKKANVHRKANPYRVRNTGLCA